MILKYFEMLYRNLRSHSLGKFLINKLQNLNSQYLLIVPEYCFTRKKQKLYVIMHGVKIIKAEDKKP